MTSNHLLLYRLAELMLEHEQHNLPVDLLFDDEQIGDLVKSIQIDSPYQQMVLEGVLTESVREEKLYVSFTVEGYFHYVLGEVIYNQTNGKGPECLKQIVEECKLNAAKEGVEQCLIRDVLLDDLTRLMWLIDEGGKVLEVCSIPLANAFLVVKRKAKTEDEKRQLQQIQVYEVFNKLFKNITENDISILEKSIDYLKSVQQNKIVEIIFIKINETIPPKNINNVILYVDSIQYIAVEKREKQLDNILQIEFETNNLELLSLLYQRIASQFDYISKFTKSFEYFNKSLEIELKIYGKQHPNIASLYHYIGVLWQTKKEYEKALGYHQKSLEIRIISLGEFHIEVANSYNSIGNIWSRKGLHSKSLEFHQKSLDIRLKNLGKVHPEIGKYYNNIGNVFLRKKDYNNALKSYKKSLSIYAKSLGEFHPNVSTLLNNIGNIWNRRANYTKAKKYYNLSLHLYIKNYGLLNPNVATSYNNIGLVYFREKDYINSINHYKKSLDIRVKLLGENHSDVLSTYKNIGLVFEMKKEFAEANENFIKVFEITKESNLSYKIAQCYEVLNQPIEALDYYIQSAEIRKEDIGIEDEATQESIANAKRLSKELNKESELPEWMF